MKTIARILILISFFSVLFSCADFPKSGRPPSDADSAQVRQAEKLLKAEKYQDAATLFWSLAEKTPSPQKEVLQIRAAEAVLHPETKLQAKQYLSAINETALTQDLFVRKRVANAELALMNGQPKLALDAVTEKILTLSDKYRPHALAVRAKALKSVGSIWESIETRIELNPLLTRPEQLSKNNELIWQTILNSNIEEIQTKTKATDNPKLLPWLSLAHIQKQVHENLPSLENKLLEWRRRFPNNNIPSEIVDSIRNNWASFRIAPNRIALLLPMTGRYSKVAEAIYAGINNAREFGEAFNPVPELVLYDTGDNPSAALSYYRRAVNEGADFIIGPLQKEAVSALANRGQLEVPTLSLNYSDTILSEPNNLFQFGLLPEDEARQVAERALLDNHQTALVLVPDGEWGTRLLEAFTSRFFELGGIVLQSERYFPEDSDYSYAIKSLFQLNDSEQRHRAIESIIRKNAEFEPRRRQDADFIFIAASPQHARLLRPQLSYYFATDLPVYATSHIFSGNENISADQDINNITYCDIPWLLSNDPTLELLRDSLDLQQSSSSSRLPRFAALGIDAYQIIPHLQRLAAYGYDRYNGTTGKLSLDESNRIYRELSWAKFEDGRPLPISSSNYSTQLLQNL